MNAAKADKKENAGADKDIVSAMIAKGLGGVDNISDVDCCATRLRCTVIDEKKVDEGVLKQSGAAGVICKGNGIQVIYGPKVSVIKSNLEDYLDNPVEVDLDSEPAPEAKQEDTNQGSTESVVFACPLKGKVDSITTAPDPAFSEKMMGDGIVIVPTDNVVYAPMDCEIAFVFPSKHAIGLVTDSGLEALIHVGIDTVKLEGQGFNVFVNDGDKVKRGDKLMEFDLEYIRNNAADIATPFIITNLPDNQSIHILKTGDVEVNTEVMEVK